MANNGEGFIRIPKSVVVYEYSDITYVISAELEQYYLIDLSMISPTIMMCEGY